MMKKLLILILLLISNFLYSQSIENCLKHGDSHHLSKYFATCVDINLPNFNDNVQNNQAEQILKDFFKKNKPIDFILDKLSIGYVIGLYISKVNYDVYIVMNNKQIISISFDIKN